MESDSEEDLLGSSSVAPERVAVYARTSTGEQTIERQFQECLSHLEKRGHTPKKVDRYSDKGVSGADSERSDYVELQEEISSGEVDLVVVTEMSRVTRTGSEEALNFIRTCLESSCGLEFTQVPLSFDRGDDELTQALNRVMGVLLAELAKVEREQMLERVYSGIAAAQERGKWTGTPPRGFIQESGEPLRLDLTEYLNTRRAVERVEVEGQSKRSVAKDTGIPRATLQRYCNEERYRDLYLHRQAYDEILQNALEEGLPDGELSEPEEYVLDYQS